MGGGSGVVVILRSEAITVIPRSAAITVIPRSAATRDLLFCQEEWERAQRARLEMG